MMYESIFRYTRLADGGPSASGTPKFSVAGSACHVGGTDAVLGTLRRMELDVS